MGFHFFSLTFFGSWYPFESSYVPNNMILVLFSCAAPDLPLTV